MHIEEMSYFPEMEAFLWLLYDKNSQVLSLCRRNVTYFEIGAKVNSLFLYTLTSQYKNRSFSARALLTNPLRCLDTIG